jgi:hypothetical protein
MISYYNYWQTLRRLEQSHETLKLMEPDVPPMVEAQHEMITREAEYWREESHKCTIIVLLFFAFAGIMAVFYMKSMIHV